MAVEYHHLAIFFVFLVIGYTDIFCTTVDPKFYDPLIFERPTNQQRDPANPWNTKNYNPSALEGPAPTKPAPAPANPQPIPGGRRDFVANPTPGNTNPGPSQGVNNNGQAPGGTRDFVANPKPVNKGQTFVNAPGSNINGQTPVAAPVNNDRTPPGGKRDFVANPSAVVNPGGALSDPTLANGKTTTTPWPELGGRRNGPPAKTEPLPNPVWVRPSSPPPSVPNTNKRDFVANPRPVIDTSPNKPTTNNNPLINNKPSNIPSAPKNPVSFIGGTTTTTTTSKPASTDPKEKNRNSEDSELREFSEVLLKKDVNSPLKHVTINYQGMTRSNSLKDEAPQPLLSINAEAYQIPSVAKLILLHNNYILDSSTNEVYTAQEKIEENNFLDTILPTAVMQHTRNFLVQKGKLGKDPKEFRDTLKTIWFNMYSRGGGKIGSSGFEHVFLAEIKNNTISGLHNWLYFKEEEKKNKANYLGYMKKIEFDKGAIVKYHFNFHDIDKPVGSMFVGTSPELELALYSTCFLMRPNDVCPLRLGGKNFGIRTYSYRYRGKDMIGSAFPDI